MQPTFLLPPRLLDVAAMSKFNGTHRTAAVNPADHSAMFLPGGHSPIWLPYAVRDGNLITGQNPQASALVANHVATALLNK